jgi:hypothetical protein
MLIKNRETVLTPCASKRHLDHFALPSGSRAQTFSRLEDYRIRFSSSLNFMVPLLDDTVLCIVDDHIVQFIESSVKLG